MTAPGFRGWAESRLRKRHATSAARLQRSSAWRDRWERSGSVLCCAISEEWIVSFRLANATKSHLCPHDAAGDLEAEEVTVDGIRIRVATPRMLYRMKKDTVRPRDRADAEEIKQHFGLEEEE